MAEVLYGELSECPDYRVGTDGSIWTCKGKGPGSGQPGWRKRKLSCQPETGYWYVSLYRNGKSWRPLVHRLVLKTFVGPCPPGHECRHTDGDKSNNALSNLSWGTKLENAADTIQLGRQVHGERHHSAKLTESQVRGILQELAEGKKSQQQLAEEHNCNQMSISKIKRGVSWKHVPRPVVLS